MILFAELMTRLSLGWNAVWGRLAGLWVGFLLMVAIAFLLGDMGQWAQAAPLDGLTVAIAPASETSGAQLFEIHCAGCHINGGNILRRGKTLKLKALQRNQVDSLEAIATLVTQGKGNMSAYGAAAEPGGASRLTPMEIETVSAYVLAQAEAGWH